MRRLTEESITTEVVDGFANAAIEAERLRQTNDMSRYQLDHYLAPLRDQALKGSRWRALRLQRSLASSAFRAHLETARQNSLVMRRSYLLANCAA